MVGGDVLKAFLFSTKISKKPRVYLSVIVDRFFGLFGFAMFALIMLAITLSIGLLEDQAIYSPLLSVSAIILVILSMVVILVNHRLQNFFLSINALS